MAHKRKAVQAKEASTLTYGAAAGDRKTGKRGRRSAMPDDLAFGTEHEASKNTLEHPEQSWDVAMTDHFVMAIRHSAAYGEQAEDARHSERKEAATLRQLDYHQQLTRLADDACAGTQYAWGLLAESIVESARIIADGEHRCAMMAVSAICTAMAH